MDYSKLGTAAAESDDLTQNKSFEREVPREGIALLRLREYVELGRHESRNPKHKPALKAMLVFELSHPDHLVEIDGVKAHGMITVRTNKGATTKSGYKKLFNVMNKACGGNKQHFVQMINEPFIADIHHVTTGEGEDKRTYANLDLDGAWSLRAPVQIDTLTNVSTPVPVPELENEAKVFLWENTSVTDAQILEMWESIFIEGEREVEDPVTKKMKTVSKNWIQETIMKNLEWEGSVTQALTQEDISLDAPPEEDLSALAGAASSEEVPTI